MNITGKFEVTLLNQKTFESKKINGENLITNIGKDLLNKWLAHDCFSQNSYGNDNLSGGKTFLNEKIISYKEIETKNYCTNSSNYYLSKNSENCLYSPTINQLTYAFIAHNNYSSFDNMPESQKRESSIYFDFKEPKRIKKIVLLCSPCDNYEYDGYGCQLEISTSPNTSSENTNWTVRKNMMVANDWNIIINEDTEKIDFEKLYDLPIYLGDRNNPEKIIDNVKSIRISSCYYGLKIYRAVFFEEVDYPTPPFIIGLGTSSLIPQKNDKDLGNKICNLLAKCNYSIDESGLPIITYRTKLGIREFNGNTFREIGLYCTDGMLPYSGEKLKLFSHGLFEKEWTKNQDVVADIKYVLTGGN